VILSIVFLSLSCVILYDLVRKRLEIEKSIEKKIVILILIVGIFFNMYLLEWFIFLESVIMSLGVIASISAAYVMLQYKTKMKYLYTTVLFIISVFCYQASIIIGGSILILFIIYDNRNNNIIKIINKLILAMYSYGIALISNFVFVRLINNGGYDTRASGNIDIVYNIKYSIKAIKSYFIETYNYLPKCFLIVITGLIIIVSIYYLVKKEGKIINKIYYGIYMTFIFFCFWLLSILPILALSSDSIYFMPRSVPFFGGVFGFVTLICTLFTIGKVLENKYVKLLIVGNFIIITILMINIQCENMKNSAQDLLVGKIIYQNIIQYEKNNNIKVDTIIMLPDSQVVFQSSNIHRYSDITARAFSSDWSTSSIMKFITEERYKIITGTKQDKERIFKDLEASDFNINQIKFEGNILYLLLY
jgi:hypothetical protein